MELEVELGAALSSFGAGQLQHTHGLLIIQAEQPQSYTMLDRERLPKRLHLQPVFESAPAAGDGLSPTRRGGDQREGRHSVWRQCSKPRGNHAAHAVAHHMHLAPAHVILNMQVQP